MKVSITLISGTFNNTPAWTEVHIYSHSQARSWRKLVRLPTDGHRWCLLYCEIQRHLGWVTGRLHLYGDFLSEYMTLHTASPHHYCCRLNLQKSQHRPDFVRCMFACSRYNWHGYVLVLGVCVKSVSLTIFRRTCYVITAKIGEGILRPSLRSG
jgi:hypothetical protein